MFTVASCLAKLSSCFLRFGHGGASQLSFHVTSRHTVTIDDSSVRKNREKCSAEIRRAAASRHNCSTSVEKRTELSYVNAGATVRIAADARAAALVQLAEINTVVADEPMKSTRLYLPRQSD